MQAQKLDAPYRQHFALTQKASDCDSVRASFAQVITMKMLAITVLSVYSAALGAQDGRAGVDVEAPGVSAKVDTQGVVAEAPGVSARVDSDGVEVAVPGVEVDVSADGVRTEVAGVSVDIDAQTLDALDVDTNSVQGRSETTADAPAPSTFTTISVSMSEKRYACKAGEGVAITGAGSVYILSGPCDTVRVSGTGNDVSIDTVRRIEVTGTGNSISWTKALVGKAPVTVVDGIGNGVTQD